MTSIQVKRYINLHFSYFSGPDDGVMEFQKVKIVKTRKAHHCCGVSRPAHDIPAGVEAVSDTAKYDGQVGTAYICLPCLDAWEKRIQAATGDRGVNYECQCPACRGT